MTFRIRVAVKRGIDHGVTVKVRPNGAGVDLANVKMSMNPFDEIAVEEAVQLKEAGVSDEVANPYGIGLLHLCGWKRSDFGDLDQHGPDAFRFDTRTKTITTRWPSGIKEGAEFVILTMG